MENNSTKSSGIGLSTILFLIFLVLKLIGVITWSWWWVFSPIWIPFILSVLVVIVIYGFIKK